MVRKRQRLEDYPESKTVHKLADMIGRGKISVNSAAELASSIVSCHIIDLSLEPTPLKQSKHSVQKACTGFRSPRLKTTRSCQILQSELLLAWGQIRSMGGTLKGTCIDGFVAYTISSCSHTRSIWCFKHLGISEWETWTILQIYFDWICWRTVCFYHGLITLVLWA